MAIKKCCENCYLGKNCELRDECITSCYHFMPKEEVVREDEKNKIITLLNSDLETLDLSEYDNMVLNENSAVANYIKSVKALLEKEK